MIAPPIRPIGYGWWRISWIWIWTVGCLCPTAVAIFFLNFAVRNSQTGILPAHDVPTSIGYAGATLAVVLFFAVLAFAHQPPDDLSKHRNGPAYKGGARLTAAAIVAVAILAVQPALKPPADYSGFLSFFAFQGLGGGVIFAVFWLFDNAWSDAYPNVQRRYRQVEHELRRELEQYADRIEIDINRQGAGFGQEEEITRDLLKEALSDPSRAASRLAVLYVQVFHFGQARKLLREMKREFATGQKASLSGRFRAACCGANSEVGRGQRFGICDCRDEKAVWRLVCRT